MAVDRDRPTCLRNVWLPPGEDRHRRTGVRVCSRWRATPVCWLLYQRDLKARTREHYRALLDRPHPGDQAGCACRWKSITANDVRAWHAAAGLAPPRRCGRTAYGLLRTIMGTAVTGREDRRLTRA